MRCLKYFVVKKDFSCLYSKKNMPIFSWMRAEWGLILSYPLFWYIRNVPGIEKEGS